MSAETKTPAIDAKPPQRRREAALGAPARTTVRAEVQDRTLRTGSLVKPVSNAFRIIRYLQQRGAPARASQIAADLKLNMSTCFNILRTMVAEEVVDFSEPAKTYALGMGLAKLVDQSQIESLRTAAMQAMLERLSQDQSITTTLWRLSGPDRIELVAMASGPGELRLHMSMGLRLPRLMGATGRVIAGVTHMTKSQVRSGFRSLRWERDIDFETYWEGVQFAAEHGWAFDDGYYTRGITSIAAPVVSAQGEIPYVISLVAFRGQFEDEELPGVGAALKAFSEEFGHRML